MALGRKEIAALWIEYLKESNFKKEHGKAMYQDYVDKRIKAYLQAKRLTPFPVVRKLSDVIGAIIDQAHSEAISDGDLSFEHLKKRIIYDIKLIEQTGLLLHIHCPSIPPREGQKAVLQEVGAMLKAKLKDARDIREFYSAWTEPGERIEPEIAMYLELYRGQKRGLKSSGLRKIALEFSARAGSKRLNKEESGYLEDSQIRRAIGYAKKIIQNVEKGHFPGKYKNIS